MPSHTPTPEFVTVAEPPEPRVSLRRRVAVFMRDAVVGGLLAGTATLALAAAVPIHPDGLDRSHCFPSPREADDARRVLLVIATIVAPLMEEAEIRARLREIDAFRLAEAAIRATLPRSRPGLIVPPPPASEDYR